MIKITDLESNTLPLKALKSALDFAYSGVFVINKDYKIVYLNRWASDFLNIPIEKCIGKSTTDYFPNSALAKAMVNQEFQKNMPETRNNKDVIVTRIPVYENNQVIGAIALFQDLLHLQENEMEIRSKFAEKGLIAKYTFEDIIHKSTETKHLIEISKTYAQTSSTVLITGESGTGKELFAQGIHNDSERKNMPFVAINCTTLPEPILESELFGYSDAAFTGAKKGGKIGLFQQAHMGTIFLDEIGEIPLSVQTRLLRVLQEKEIRPIGSDKIIPIDVRVISATNKNLFEEVKAGKFRLDLLYRLNVLNINIPPLRKRKKDIMEISYNYFTKHCPLLYESNQLLIKNVLKKLSTYDFPGNVRELQNILERFSLLLENNTSYNNIDSIINNLVDIHFYEEVSVAPPNLNIESEIENNERQKLTDVLIQVNGSRSKACKVLGISQSTLWRRMKKYHLL